MLEASLSSVPEDAEGNADTGASGVRHSRDHGESQSRGSRMTTSASRVSGKQGVTHPGSLYVGSGLGFKKQAEVSQTGKGSTKHILKNIIAKADL